MKLSITSFLLASATTYACTEALPSLLQPRDDALAARERLLLRPTWRPATPTYTTASGPLRRGRRAEESKIAFRHNSGRRQSHMNAAAVPIHINYAERAVNMPFPLAMQIKRDASQKEHDADQEDDWECEEEDEDSGEDSLALEHTQTTSQSSYVEQSSGQTPSVTSDGRSNPKIKPDQSSSSSSSGSPATPQAGSSNSATSSVDSASSFDSASSGDSTPARDATGSAPLSDPSNLAAGSTTAAQGCTRFHTVLAGEVCLGLLDGGKDIGLTLAQLYSYNPFINEHCTNLQVGQTLCTGKA